MLLLQPTVPLLSALPAAPVDGQVICYLTPLGVVWQFRYNAATGFSSKWDFVGGVPLYAQVGTGQARAVANAFGDLATVGPSLVIPLAGDYVVDCNCYITATGSPVTDLMAMGPFKGTGTGNPPSWAKLTVTGANYVYPLAHLGEPFTFAAGDTVKLQYYSQTSTTATFDTRRLTVRPIRVGP